jgi:hypothetical protein
MLMAHVVEHVADQRAKTQRRGLYKDIAGDGLRVAELDMAVFGRRMHGREEGIRERERGGEEREKPILRRNGLNMMRLCCVYTIVPA